MGKKIFIEAYKPGSFSHKLILLLSLYLPEGWWSDCTGHVDMIAEICNSRIWSQSCFDFSAWCVIPPKTPIRANNIDACIINILLGETCLFWISWWWTCGCHAQVWPRGQKQQYFCVNGLTCVLSGSFDGECDQTISYSRCNCFPGFWKSYQWDM